jgi:hypothetical protein
MCHVSLAIYGTHDTNIIVMGHCISDVSYKAI